VKRGPDKEVFMKLTSTLKLMEKYAYCPQCGNGYISNGEGALIVEDLTFFRSCKCGFEITVDEEGNQVETP
jgi:hypothetical protein